MVWCSRYHLEVAVNRKEVVGQVEEGQGAADPPHVNGLSEGQAKGDFWSSLKGIKGKKDHIY